MHGWESKPQIVTFQSTNTTFWLCQVKSVVNEKLESFGSVQWWIEAKSENSSEDRNFDATKFVTAKTSTIWKGTFGVKSQNSSCSKNVPSSKPDQTRSSIAIPNQSCWPNVPQRPINQLLKLSFCGCKNFGILYFTFFSVIPSLTRLFFFVNPSVLLKIVEKNKSG